MNLFSMVSTGLLGRELCVYEQRRGRPAMERKLELGMSADFQLRLPTLRVGPFREKYFC